MNEIFREPAIKYRVLLALLLGTVWSLSVSAHHSSNKHYDMSNEAEVEGVVTRFRLVNPHARIYFDVTREDGTVEKWLSEGEGASILSRRGWTRDELKPGDKIKIRGNPSRDGRPLIEWITITLPDGRVLGGGNALPAEMKRNLKTIESRRRARRSTENFDTTDNTNEQE